MIVPPSISVASLLPLPAFAITVGPGAARFGRRTPEPHVWPAAPSFLFRGASDVGAGMDDDIPELSARLAALREKANREPLNVHDAERAFGDMQTVERLLSLEEQGYIYVPVYRPCAPQETRKIEADALRTEVSRILLDKLKDAQLVATGFPCDGKVLLAPIPIPAATWNCAELYAWGDEAWREGKKILTGVRIIRAPNAEGGCLQKPSQRKAGAPKTEKTQFAEGLAREWLLDHGEDLQEARGKQAQCVKWVAGRLSRKDLEMSDSHLKTIVKDVARQIADEKANNSGLAK